VQNNSNSHVNSCINRKETS
jgi:hypothetical protein